jgi:hypothetical protein
LSSPCGNEAVPTRAKFGYSFPLNQGEHTLAGPVKHMSKAHRYGIAAVIVALVAYYSYQIWFG